MEITSKIIKREQYNDSTVYSLHVLVDGEELTTPEEAVATRMVEKLIPVAKIDSVDESGNPTMEFTEELQMVEEEYLDTKEVPKVFRIQIQDTMDKAEALREYLINIKKTLSPVVPEFLDNITV